MVKTDISTKMARKSMERMEEDDYNRQWEQENALIEREQDFYENADW